jgi:hypothetical protein
MPRATPRLAVIRRIIGIATRLLFRTVANKALGLAPRRCLYAFTAHTRPAATRPIAIDSPGQAAQA